MRSKGYSNLLGLDLDPIQTEIGKQLGLDTRRMAIEDHFANDTQTYGLVAMLDIIEHFTREELFPLLETVVSRLRPGGRLLVSVPNAESPHAARAIYADITHEIAFTPTSLEEMFFCHHLKLVALRDPWPAPISPARKAYRAMSDVMRKAEGMKLRLLGFDSPKYWSSVIWAVAEKPLAAKSEKQA